MSFRRSNEDPYLKRLATAAAVVTLGLIVASFFGPSADQIDRWIKHTGAEGDLVLLDYVDIVPDIDPVVQEQKESSSSAMVGLEVEPLDLTPTESPEVLPITTESGTSNATTELADDILKETGNDTEPVPQAEQHRAQQSLDFVLLKFVSPDYPAQASATTRAREVWVIVAMYVDASGKVADAYTTRNDGGPAFSRAVLSAVKQWEYEPLVINGEARGFWDEIHWRFVATQNGYESQMVPPSQRGR